MKYLKTFEDVTWADSILNDLDVGNLAEYDDGYFTMVLDDIDYINNGMILHVSFFETNDKQHHGSGKFKYINSDIPTLSGDIIPMKMNGILQEIFYDEEEIIYDFVNRLVDQI
jgi:hypothetical protein